MDCGNNQDPYAQREMIGNGHDTTFRRKRRWEQRHLDEKVVYRGVDPGYVRKVQRLAADLHVPQGKVARSILEYAVRRFEEGFLDLIPRSDPNRTRNTLRPPNQNNRKRTMKHTSVPHPAASWRTITTWRNFSPEFKRTLSALASEEALNVPVGELVNALLRYGLQAHKAGLLRLDAVEKTTVLNLLGEDEG